MDGFTYLSGLSPAILGEDAHLFFGDTMCHGLYGVIDGIVVAAANVFTELFFQ